MKPKGDEGKMNGYRLKGRYGSYGSYDNILHDYDRDLIIDLRKVWTVESVDYNGDGYIQFVFSRDGNNFLLVKLPSRAKREEELAKIHYEMRRRS